MYTFLKIFIVVVLALALIDWLADRDRRADTNIPNATSEWAFLSGDIKIARSAVANEVPKGIVPPGQSFSSRWHQIRESERERPYLFTYRDIDRALGFVHPDSSFHQPSAG
jgi:hypothetical protein